MPIYTKTGDKGETALFGGKRVKKYTTQVESYGSVDELTSFIGLVREQIKNKKDRQLLIEIQQDLYELMNVLCGAKRDLSQAQQRITQFEECIDRIDKKLPRLRRFILPGGTVAAGWFHVLRAITRRAERQVVRFFDEEKTIDNEQSATIIQYLNRLSDLFFMMGRKYAKGKEKVT